MKVSQSWISIRIRICEGSKVSSHEFFVPSPSPKKDVPNCWTSNVISPSLEVNSGIICGIDMEQLAELSLRFSITNVIHEFKHLGYFDHAGVIDEEKGSG